MVPATLLGALSRGEVVLFFGAGINKSSRHPDGRLMPLGNDLRDLLCDKFLEGLCKDRSLEEVATLAENERGRLVVFRFVAERLSGFAPTLAHTLLPSFRWKAIFTLNYDLLVEDAYRGSSGKLQSLKAFYKDQNNIDKIISSTPNAVPLYKLHGSLDALMDAEAPLILTTDTYIDFEKNRENIFKRFEDIALEFPVIFAGSRLSDPHIKSILAQIDKNAFRRPMYYFVSPGITSYDESFLATKRMTPLKASFDDFMTEADRQVDALARRLHGVLRPQEYSIEKHYRRNVQTPAGLAAFLTNNVEHVRENIPTVSVPAGLFFRGESQSWAPIEQRFDIERVPYATVILKVLGLDRSEEAINIVAIRGVAGAGKTVFLRRIAYDLAATHGKIVLFAPPGANIRPEPLIELQDLTGMQCVLVVDHAADQVQSLIVTLDRLESAGIRITLVIADTHASFGSSLEVLGDRVKFKTELRQLDDREIDDLIAKLAEHKSLGLLEGLAKEAQRDAFSKVADKQLLVALYEATQGRLLEDILLEEYHRIVFTEAQELYLLVCTLNRFRVPVRATLVHRVMGIGYSDFERRFLGPLSEMVFAEREPGSGDYAYRTRHPHIAEIVFSRVLNSQSKQLSQYRSVISHMNTTYSSDNEALRKMLSYRNLKDLAPGLLERRELLSLAAEISANDTFVLQQQAISEINDRNGDLDFARKCLEKAEILRPRDGTIKHTKASLLAREANQTKDEMQRSSLRIEAKEILRQVPAGERNDAYICSLVARVAIDEIEDRLQRSDANQATIARLIEDAQKALLRGLSTAPDFEALVRQNYRLRRVLEVGDHGIGMLERTLRQQPQLEHITAIYAKAVFRKSPDKALEALRNGLQHRPGSKLINQTLFELMVLKADDFRDELEAPLRKAYTREEPNLAMHVHSIRYYFMRGDNAEYQTALAVADRMRLPQGVKRVPRFSVLNSGASDGRWSGQVARIGAAGGYLSVAGLMSDIFVRPTSFLDDEMWDRLVLGARVTFELQFNCLGPVATKVAIGELDSMPRVLPLEEVEQVEEASSDDRESA